MLNEVLARRTSYEVETRGFLSGNEVFIKWSWLLVTIWYRQ